MSGKTYPDESADEVLARTKANHGAAAADTARRFIDGDLPKRDRFTARTSSISGKRPKPTPSLHTFGKDRAVRVPGADLDVNPRADYACSVTGCSHFADSGGLCWSHRLSASRNAAASRSVSDLSDDERTEIRRKVRAFESPLAVAKAFGISTNGVHAVMRSAS